MSWLFFTAAVCASCAKIKNISIAELSKLSDVSTGLISQIEREMVIPSVVSIWRLAQALDTNINYFFDEDDVDDKVIIRKNRSPHRHPPQ